MLRKVLSTDTLTAIIVFCFIGGGLLALVGYLFTMG